MKKLYRLKEGRKIAGICAGLADSYNWDVTIVRLAFVFATILTAVWPGVVTYLVGWYLIPEREHPESPESIKEGV
ncbi:MAG: PspC domain-containing protein [Fibrobacter sp.]|jgi:phage shock protein C|nr:PspC domain-containing protein [Fibrobacter sp.]HON10324.1 PspC domain-containing protein [Chitinispirillaceae bacterium]